MGLEEGISNLEIPMKWIIALVIISIFMFFVSQVLFQADYLIEHQCDYDDDSIPQHLKDCCYNFKMSDGTVIENKDRICDNSDFNLSRD